MGESTKRRQRKLKMNDVRKKAANHRKGKKLGMNETTTTGDESETCLSLDRVLIRQTTRRRRQQNTGQEKQDIPRRVEGHPR
jgi:hypothetical protein